MERQIKGIILILLGLSIFSPDLLSMLAFRVIVAFVLIWIGFRLLFSGNNKKDNNNNVNNNEKNGEKNGQ